MTDLEEAAKVNLSPVALTDFYRLVESGSDEDELRGFIWACIEIDALLEEE